MELCDGGKWMWKTFWAQKQKWLNEDVNLKQNWNIFFNSRVLGNIRATLIPDNTDSRNLETSKKQKNNKKVTERIRESDSKDQNTVPIFLKRKHLGCRHFSHPVFIWSTIQKPDIFIRFSNGDCKVAWMSTLPIWVYVMCMIE